MQEDKEPAFDAIDNFSLAIAAMTGMVKDLEPNAKAMRAAAQALAGVGRKPKPLSDAERNQIRALALRWFQEEMDALRKVERRPLVRTYHVHHGNPFQAHLLSVRSVLLG